jgi:enterochelin esterase-like enzyme
MSAGAQNQRDGQFVAMSRDVTEHPEVLKKNLKLLHFVVGDQDVLHEADKRLAVLLRTRGVKLTFQTVPGMHECKV